jgi:TonB family protein
MRNDQWSIQSRFTAAVLLLGGLCGAAAAAPASSEPALSQCAQPAYPKGALRAEQEGTVVIEYRLGSDGKVAQTRVAKSSGHALLDDASQEGVARCGVAPGASKGLAHTWHPVKYVWVLDGPPSKWKRPPAALPFAAAPPALRAFFDQARKADALADPLARCLAFPDLPGNKWPVGLTQAYCKLLFGQETRLATVAALVDRGAFAELEALYQRDLARHFSTDNFSEVIHLDNRLFDASPESDRVSQKWLSKAPESAFANAARGQYLLVMATEARGGRFISETPKENLYRMGQFADRAKEYFGKAVRLEPRLMPAYVSLINLGRINGEDNMGDTAFALGDAVDPACRYLSKEQMTALKPRWGGSAEAMRAYAKELAPLVASRPLLALSLVMPAADEGDTLFRGKDFAGAVTTLAPAALVAPYPDMLADLGLSMWQADADSWETLVHVLAAYRFDTDHFGVARAAGTLIAEGADPLWSVKVLKRALALEPDDAYANFQMGRSYHQLLEYELAEPYLLKVVGAGERREDALYLLTDGYASTRQFDKADVTSMELVGGYPKSARAWFQRARVKLAQDAEAQSREAFARFLKVVDPAEPGWEGMIKFAREKVNSAAPQVAPAAKP